MKESKNMKKVLAIALATLMLMGMLAGCSGSGAKKEVLTVALSPD